MYYGVKVVVGIDVDELIIDNSEKYKKVVDPPRRGKRIKGCGKKTGEKKYYYTRREYKVKGFEEETFEYNSDAWEFIEKKSRLDCVSDEDSPSTIIGETILYVSGADNSAYKSMDIGYITNMKAIVEKIIFKKFGVEVDATVHFIGYYS